MWHFTRLEFDRQFENPNNAIFYGLVRLLTLPSVKDDFYSKYIDFALLSDL